MKNMLYRAKPLLKIGNKLCEIKIYTNFLLRLLKILLKCYFKHKFGPSSCNSTLFNFVLTCTNSGVYFYLF